MDNIEQTPPDPDEFGKAPRERKDLDPLLEGEATITPSFHEIIEDSMKNLDYKTVKDNNNIRSWSPGADNDVWFYGSGHSFPNPLPFPETAPKDRPDPYPSRAGWREDYLTTFDPTLGEVANKAKGFIGGYKIIESATTFDDIGGNELAKSVLLDIANQFGEPELYAKWDVPVPKGVLLYGVPGTGKTMIAKAFANKAEAAFIEVPVADLRDKFYGESERKLKAIYDEASRYNGRVVIFIDELDSLLGDRTGLHSSHPDVALVNTFLQAMDGMQSATNVMTLGATNHPGKLDSAAIRPGRFDRKVAVQLPDKQACAEIAAKRLLSAERNSQRILVEDELNLDEISTYLVGLSGADIAEIINRVKRTMAQTERSVMSDIIIEGLGEAIIFDGEIDDRKITTDDITATTISYKISR